MMPYAFKGLKMSPQVAHSQKLVFACRAQLDHYFKEDQQLYKTFDEIQEDVLQAMGEEDLEYLQGIMEPRLFARYQSSLSDLHAKGQRLHYYEVPGLETNTDFVTAPLSKVDMNMKQCGIRDTNEFMEKYPFGY